MVIHPIQSYFGELFWAFFGGGVLVVGLLVELLAEKSRFKSIKSFRVWHRLKKLGEWMVIVGVLIETADAGWTAHKIRQANTSIANADPRNLPITSISGWIRVVVKPPSKDFAATMHLRPIYQNPPGALEDDEFLKTGRKTFCVFGRLGDFEHYPNDFGRGIPIVGQITSMRCFENASPELDGNVRFDIRFDSNKEGVPVWNMSNLTFNQLKSVQFWISNEWPPPRGVVEGQADVWVNGLWKESFQVLAQTNRDFPYRVATTNLVEPPYNF